MTVSPARRQAPWPISRSGCPCVGWGRAFRVPADERADLSATRRCRAGDSPGRFGAHAVAGSTGPCGAGMLGTYSGRCGCRRACQAGDAGRPVARSAADRWVLVIETAGYNPRAANLVDVLNVYGNVNRSHRGRPAGVGTGWPGPRLPPASIGHAAYRARRALGRGPGGEAWRGHRGVRPGARRPRAVRIGSVDVVIRAAELRRRTIEALEAQLCPGLSGRAL